MTVAEAITALNISDDVTKTNIKKQFRQAAHTHHPDKKGSAKQFERIKEAYDLLMKLSIEDIRSQIKIITPNSAEPGHYDPFADSKYDHRSFFQPDNPRIEGYERKLRAKNCPHCSGIGTITKNTQPEKGFLGLETRLCKCQWV
ncbi:MAG: DnaJ domain-containing protein [Candidatus Saccharimonadales bacterium]